MNPIHTINNDADYTHSIRLLNEAKANRSALLKQLADTDEFLLTLRNLQREYLQKLTVNDPPPSQWKHNV